MQHLLFGVGPRDPLTPGAAAATLVGAALVAAWAPARGAARSDPMDVLRRH
jgi:ABC-type lipoprotein release transport system permease subunit